MFTAAEATRPERACIIVFSGELDRAMAAYNIAIGAAASGMDVTLFFTFWGINLLKKIGARRGASSLLGRMFDRMMAAGPARAPLSKFNMGGLGAACMRLQMRSKGAAALSELMATARELGVRHVACTMSMDVMEIPPEDLEGVDELAGVAAFLERATGAALTLFI